MLLFRSVIVILFPFLISSDISAQALQTVDNVDLERYAGKWYEIASYPHRFQRGCNCTTAEYTTTDKGSVTVVHRCIKDSVSAPQSYIKSKAIAKKNSGNAKLKVQFFGPFKAKYWIIDLDDDYQYAVVSHPNREYLWILSRTPVMDNVVYQQIIARLKEKDFDLSKIVPTTQNCWE